jgi:hypothetical protein
MSIERPDPRVSATDDLKPLIRYSRYRTRARGLVRIWHLPPKQAVKGSNPFAPAPTHISVIVARGLRSPFIRPRWIRVQGARL